MATPRAAEWRFENATAGELKPGDAVLLDPVLGYEYVDEASTAAVQLQSGDRVSYVVSLALHSERTAVPFRVVARFKHEGVLRLHKNNASLKP